MAGLYFPHDLTARNDPKIIKLLKRFGMEGFGIYWALLEMLGSNSEHRIPADYEDIAWEFRCDAEKIRAVVCEFGLFEFTDAGEFYSERLSRHFESVDSTREKRAISGRKGAEKRWQNDKESIANSGCAIANAIETDNKTMAIAKDFIAEKQEKQEKEKKQEKDCLLAQAKEKEKSERASEQAAEETELFLNTETYSDVVTDLANEIAQRFGLLQAMPIHRQQVMKLINAIHIRGQDTPGKIREALKKLDTAEVITSGKITFGIDQFFYPECFCKLLNGYYDKLRKRDKKTTPDLGVSFEQKAKEGYYKHD